MAAGKSLDMTRRTALYRLYDATDVLLYVGIGFDPRARWYHHASTKPWWPEVTRKEVEWHADRVQAEVAEKASIVAELPRYNIAGVDDPVVSQPRRRRACRPKTPALDDRLRRTQRKFRRTKQIREKARLALRMVSASAAREGLGPAEITRLIDHEYDVAHVSRIIHGKA